MKTKNRIPILQLYNKKGGECLALVDAVAIWGINIFSGFVLDVSDEKHRKLIGTRQEINGVIKNRFDAGYSKQ